MKRTRALQRKQMAGNNAPPSRSSDVSVMYSWTPSQQYSALLSPNTSILKDLARPQAGRTSSLASTSTSSTSTSASTSATMSTSASTPPRDVQYSELLKSAIAVDRGDANVSADSQVEVAPSQPEANKSFVSPLLPGRAAHSLASKMKGLIFSYLPRSPKATSTRQKPAPAAHGPVLPVPPAERFTRPRPPIITPARKQTEKPVPPNTLVQLNPVPPPKPSMIPRPTQQPQRWVQLNPVPSRPPSSMGLNASTLRERRDSGASVKDLVKTFETMEKTQVAERESQNRLESKRNRSIKQWNEARTIKSSKPTWRP